MTIPKLELIDVHKRFGDYTAVDTMSLAIEAGETVALLGPSGCGKSTILNMIVGLDRPTTGDIHIDGRSVINLPPGARGVGLVFQDYAVFTHMTVRRNLGFGLAIKRVPKSEIDRAVHDVAELLELTSLLDVSPKQLGGSELQRVAIGRTLIVKPAILLLDEPLSNLEAAMRLAMRQQLRKLQAETGQTIIYVTHDQIEALSLAHRIAVMSKGELRQFAPTHQVYTDPAHTFVGSFLGSPPMNFIEGRLDRDGARSLLVSDAGELTLPPDVAARLAAVNGHVILGFRPELVHVGGDNDSRFPATVSLVEPRGPELVVTVRLRGAGEVRAVVPSGQEISVGDAVGLRVAPSAICAFDAITRKRLNGAFAH